MDVEQAKKDALAQCRLLAVVATDESLVSTIDELSKETFGDDLNKTEVVAARAGVYTGIVAGSQWAKSQQK